MDDIWNESEEEWRKLKNLLMIGMRGSKIMITKRDSKVAAEIESMTSLFTLKGLPENSSWSLFREVAFKEGKEPTNPNLVSLGKDILATCGGVPLVIRHIGRLLYSKTSEEEWMSFKNNEVSKVTQENNDMTSILELSYNHLPPHLKQCFAHSSLFPKGYEIEINELIRQWVAQGFIESTNGSKSMEDIGKDYFKELCWRFFYENSIDECNLNGFICMHDVMRDLARKVAGKKVYVHGNPNNEYVVSEQTLHISFDYEIKSWKDVLSKLSKAKGLRTFLLLPPSYYHEVNEVNKNVLDELFSSFPRMRVLVLPGTNINTMTSSIKKLRHLRYLDLTENNMELLPNSITKLQNLQTLKLTDCYKLKELPRDTDRLVNLRHLAFPYMELTHIPEWMGKLTCLQTITSAFVLDYCKRTFDKLSVSGVNELLNHISGQLKIQGLEQLEPTLSEEVSLVNLKDTKGLRNLTLEWTRSLNNECNNKADETVMEFLEPHPNIESLTIYGYRGVGLSNWVSCSLSKLTEIVIENCHGLQHLPQLDHLQALKKLELMNLRCLKFIDKNDPYSSSSSSSMFFPCLQSLWLKNLPNLEGWWELVARDQSIRENIKWMPPSFPQLKLLNIYHCPKLSSMPKPTGANVSLCDVGVEILMSSIGPLWCLRSLILEEIKNLKYLPDQEFQHNQASLASPIPLEYLKIEKCPNLMSLPEWIGILTSLGCLHISLCPRLKSLPQGMRLLKSLQFLHIHDCPQLEQKCMQGGDDWPNISHVPNIIVFPKYHP